MPKYDREVYDVDCEIKNETDKAWLIVVDGKDYWVPKSIGDFTPTSPDQVSGEMTLPQWFIDKEGIEV
jgi:hypothetical protein